MLAQPASQPEEKKYGIFTGMSISSCWKRLTINGFLCTDPALLAKYMASFPADMVAWLAQGKIKTKEEVFAKVNKELRGISEDVEGGKVQQDSYQGRRGLRYTEVYILI